MLGDSPGFKQQNSCSALFCKQKWDCRVVCWFDATRNQRNKFKTCIYPCKWRDYQQSENHRMVQVQSWNSSKHTMIKLIFPYNEKCIQKIYTWINNLNIKKIYIYTWGKRTIPCPPHPTHFNFPLQPQTIGGTAQATPISHSPAVHLPAC